MPIPTPTSGENEKDFVSRCISKIIDEYDQSQAAAICYSKYRKKMSEDKKEQLFVLTPRKNENRGMYLKRCSAHSKIKSQFQSLKERSSFCLSSFNEYYKYWNKIDMAEAPKDSALGECIAREKAKGFDYKEAYAHCSSKVGSKPLGAGESITLAEEMNIFGVRPKYFDMCPMAQELFKHFTEMGLDEETIGMVRSAALVADRVFEIEKMVIENESVDEPSMMEAQSLVQDFKDIIHEIDEETGMVHDTSFMDGHIEKIKSYMEMSEDLLVEPVEFSEAMTKCIDNHVMAGFPKDKSMEFCKSRMVK